jgi:segregation and condensation protein B
MFRSKSSGDRHKVPPAAHLGLESFRTPAADEGLSLDKLKGAFASMLGAGDDPYSVPGESTDDPLQTAIVLEEDSRDEMVGSESGCEITPRSILEAMLFVGLPDGKPLAARQVAALMRGVRAAEIDELVRDLNNDYATTGRPYRIASDGSGYRMSLRNEFAGVRDKFAGRAAQARLSAAAVEVLAVVAYHQPITAEKVSQMRDTPSGRILSQLVRRQLLRIERPTDGGAATARYSTTDRFLRLVGVERLEDLPRSLDLDRQ